jgi:hypothetical protein
MLDFHSRCIVHSIFTGQGLVSRALALTFDINQHLKPGYLFTKDLTTKIKISFILYTQLNATRPQVRMEVLLHAGIISFGHFKIYD